MILGIGVDVVTISEFAEQLAQPGSRFADVFTARERRVVHARGAGHSADAQSPDVAAHYAARWAAKEAFVKAWSAALYGKPPVVGEAVWSHIEVVQDKYGRPALEFRGEVTEALKRTCGDTRVHLSMTHDGDIATAFVVLEEAR